MTDGTRRHIGDIVPLNAEKSVERVAYDDETRTRCFVLYATFAARNCAKTARLYANEVKELGSPVPDVRTIQHWAADDDWYHQADDLWRNSKGRTPYELQLLTAANTMQGQQALHDILTGADMRPIEERLVTLKAIEVAMKTRERVPDLARVEPPEPDTTDDELSRDEREAIAKQAIARGTPSRTGT